MNDRMARAEDYVFGLMDEHERERAERDMERDAEFRNCVMLLAERLSLLREQQARPAAATGDATPEDGWGEISARLSNLPHMAPAPSTSAPVRKSRPPRFVGRGAHETGGRRGTLVAVGLALVFLLGYLAGKLG